MHDWAAVIGRDPDSFCDDLVAARPPWITGSLSGFDTKYLFSRALEAQPTLAVEIGTASGFSTAVLAHALAIVARAEGGGASFRVATYDLHSQFYADETKAVGDAARELLHDDLLRNVDFRNPAKALDIADDFPPDSIGFLFIDANHKHPWPALDLLAVLPCLRAGAEVVLHDINLPRLHHGEFPVWGAKHLFDDLDVGKDHDDQAPLPNIGSIHVPDDKEALRRNLLDIVAAHEWEADVEHDVVSRASGAPVTPAASDNGMAPDDAQPKPSAEHSVATGKGRDPDYSSFILLLARQRSGTNALRSVLDEHPAIQCLPEIFHPEPSPDAHLEAETNYFNFVESHPIHDFKQTLTSEEAQKQVFLDFLDYLRCFSEKPFQFLDVKYNSTHHIHAPWRSLPEKPTLFSLIQRQRLRLLNVKRTNYLRYYVSQLKAEQTNQWTALAHNGTHAQDSSITVPIAKLVPLMELCRAEDAIVDRSFRGYDQALTIEYEDLFPRLGEPPSAAVLEQIADWLGADPRFPTTDPQYRKQAVATLGETIENYDEVVETLRGTDFEYCLEDEHMYSPARALYPAPPRGNVESALELADAPWNRPGFDAPQDAKEVINMLLPEEQRMLYYLAREYYSGAGALLDMGAFLGGSTVCFAAGLRSQGVSEPVLHSYDLFRPGPFELERYFANTPPPDNSTRPIFDANIRDYLDLLVVHEGDLLHERWSSDQPIEILFVDIAKSFRTWDHIVREFFPALIAGRSLVILQDYLYQRTGPWHHVVMEFLAPHFDYVIDTGRNSAVFRLTSPLSDIELAAAQWEQIPPELRLELMQRAIDRMDTEAKREVLAGPLEILERGGDATLGRAYHALSPPA